MLKNLLEGMTGNFSAGPMILQRLERLSGPGRGAALDSRGFFSFSRSIPEKSVKARGINALVYGLLQLFAHAFNLRPDLRQWLTANGKGKPGKLKFDRYLDFSVGIRSRDNQVKQTLVFENGRVRAIWGMPEKTDTSLVFRTPEHVLEMLRATPDEAMIMLVENRMNTEGNLALTNLFNFYLNLLLGKKQQEEVDKRIAENRKRLLGEAKPLSLGRREEKSQRRNSRISARSVDKGLKYLEDPFLPEWGLEDFPRLGDIHSKIFTVRPKICAERPRLLTEWHRENGFETDREGRPWNPELRQALALQHLLSNKKPIVWENDLLGGTSGTSFISPLIYPDASGTTIWGELFSCRDRELVPYEVDDETINELHYDIFPFWSRRNIREWVRDEYASPLCQRIDEHMAAFLIWKTIGASETIPDFESILTLGTSGLISKMEDELLRDKEADRKKIDTLRAMMISLQGVNACARNVASEARNQAALCKDHARREELDRIAKALSHAPERPARTLFEAVQAVWIVKIALNMENSNDGMGYGRLDQLLQPYFAADMELIPSPAARRDYVKKAVELLGCLFLKTKDHTTLNPDLANHIFGGSPPSQTVTVGGVTPDGEDAVNDMSYVILKVTELLGLDDPNVNVRYSQEKNSAEFLRRANDVNYITGATPAIHNDSAMIGALSQHGYDIRDIRDWAATGCVEPTMSGRHYGHTSAINISIVAALEMALNNGHHPLMGWDLGPQTGDISANAFPDFESFFRAFEAQFGFLIDQSVEYNNLCGKVYQKYRPSNLLSALTRGCVEKGRTVVNGGAKINSTGATCIGLADVADSLMVIKKLVFDQKKVSFRELKEAIDRNFEGHEALRKMAVNRVGFFGSGDPEAVAMANRVAGFAHDSYASRENYRGGGHHTGFWSMSSHAAYGRLTGALPSGRLSGKPFTPGLTPEPNASPNLLDNLNDVARLESKNLDNNIAFNVKVVPGLKDSHEKVVDYIHAYSLTFFQQGGMQIQMNVVSTEMLKDAMAHPENYRNLLVRISGYCAFFTQLDEDAQRELIERAEYGL